MEVPLLVWFSTGAVSAFIVAVLVIGALTKRLSRLQSILISRSTRHGMMAEQLLPFSKAFPGDPKKFKFLGAPIDGILFEEDKIVIVEFKTGRSQLSSKQQKIKELIKKGRVYFEEIRMAG